MAIQNKFKRNLNLPPREAKKITRQITLIRYRMRYYKKCYDDLDVRKKYLESKLYADPEARYK